MPDNSCSWEYKAHKNATSDEKQQFENCLDICNVQFMQQIIEKSSKEGNTQDVIFTIEIIWVTMIEVNKTKYSDHNLIEVSANYITTENYRKQEKNNDNDNIFWTLYFWAKSIKWQNIIEMMATIIGPQRKCTETECKQSKKRQLNNNPKKSK